MRIGVRVAYSAVFMALVLGVCARVAYSRSVGYLPRSEEMQQVVTPDNYARTVYVSACSASDSLMHKISRCQQCMAAKAACPDCCLANNLSANRCTEADNPMYGCSAAGVVCNAAAFSANDCPVVAACSTAELTNCKTANTSLPGCQARGCASGKPDVKSSACVEDAVNPGTWICDSKDNNAGPVAGCPVVANTVTDCSSIKKPYIIADLAVCPAGLTGTCYSYTPNAELSSCISACQQYTAAWEQTYKTVYCCRKGVCCASCLNTAEIGYTKFCDDSACTTRINWPECQGADTSLCCNSLTNDQCTTWNEELSACAASDTGGSCKTCYAEIDPTFHYDFIAKSNEKLAIVWQIEATPSYTPADAVDPNGYFFTMAKVFEEGKSEPVHQSIAHQRSFSAAFAIFSATVVDKGILQPGKKYTVRLYYFLPSVENYTLQSLVEQLQLILVRVRE